MRLPARIWFRRLHLVLGLTLGLVLAAVAGSGAALVFRDEIRALDPVARHLEGVWDGKDDMGFSAARDLTSVDAFVFYITFPLAPDETRQVRLQRGYTPYPYGEMHRIYFDRYTGAIVGHLLPDDSLASHYLASVNSELHYGTIGGLFTKILWFIACALVPFFSITGVLLWRRRVRRRRSTNSFSINNPKAKTAGWRIPDDGAKEGA